LLDAMSIVECCVCQASDKRGLVEVTLRGGAKATLCGSHALMHRRSTVQARSPRELRELLHDKRARSERRDETGDALGLALAAAFAGERRAVERRRA
jgi:hypothetical protein